MPETVEPTLANALSIATRIQSDLADLTPLVSVGVFRNHLMLHLVDPSQWATVADRYGLRLHTGHETATCWMGTVDGIEVTLFAPVDAATTIPDHVL